MLVAKTERARKESQNAKSEGYTAAFNDVVNKLYLK